MGLLHAPFLETDGFAEHCIDGKRFRYPKAPLRRQDGDSFQSENVTFKHPKPRPNRHFPVQHIAHTDPGLTLRRSHPYASVKR